eukprot:2023736-Pyramimonas_sp.AAC.1
MLRPEIEIEEIEFEAQWSTPRADRELRLKKKAYHAFAKRFWTWACSTLRSGHGRGSGPSSSGRAARRASG